MKSPPGRVLWTGTVGSQELAISCDGKGSEREYLVTHNEYGFCGIIASSPSLSIVIAGLHESFSKDTDLLESLQLFEDSLVAKQATSVKNQQPLVREVCKVPEPVFSDYVLSIETSFEAGHRLMNHKGDCRYLHGHSYKCIFMIASKSQCNALVDGMLIDFKDIKLKIKEVTDKFDHALILDESDQHIISLSAKVEAVDAAGFKQRLVLLKGAPTAEHIARELHERLSELVPEGVFVHSVSLWETESCGVTYSPIKLVSV